MSENIELVLSDPSITEQDIWSVKQLTAELDKRWNQRDAEAFADLFDSDADFRFYTGPWVKGKEAITSFWNGEVFPGQSASTRHVIGIERIRFVSADLMIGDGNLRIVDQVDGKEQILADRKGTLIAVKKDKAWFIAAVRLV